MITVSEVSLNFSGQALFKDVNLKFTPGNCYGIIGANGAGKTTFLRILSGELEPSTGEVVISANQRMSVLKQDHFRYDEYTVLDTVIMGNQRLYDIMKEKDALYEKEDFSDADGVKASELEAEFADMNGWEAESDASRLIQGLGLSNDILYSQMSSLTAKEKVKVLLAQALFGKPDIILLDEPTNHLDLESREALVSALQKFTGTLLMVAHDRWLLSQVGAEAWELDKSGLTVFSDFAAYDAERRSRMAGTGQTAPAVSGGLASGRNASGDQAQEASAQNLSREEQKRLKREQAEKRNALHKEIKPLQSKYDALEKELTGVLEKQGTVEAQLADPEVYAEHEKAAELLKSFEACKKRGEDIFEEMTALDERMEAVRARWNTED